MRSHTSINQYFTNKAAKIGDNIEREETQQNSKEKEGYNREREKRQTSTYNTKEKR
jgi:hypothetical protein